MNIFGHWTATDVIIHNQRVDDARRRQQFQTGGGATDSLPTAPSGAMPDGAASPISKERDLHEQVEEHCREHGYYYVHSRMDRKSTIQVGAPDFAIALPSGKMLWLELKRKGGKPTPAQLATIAHLRKLGHVAACVDNWPDAELLLR